MFERLVPNRRSALLAHIVQGAQVELAELLLALDGVLGLSEHRPVILATLTFGLLGLGLDLRSQGRPLHRGQGVILGEEDVLGAALPRPRFDLDLADLTGDDLPVVSLADLDLALGGA